MTYIYVNGINIILNSCVSLTEEFNSIIVSCKIREYNMFEFTLVRWLSIYLTVSSVYAIDLYNL